MAARRLPTVLAKLPACPKCGAKGRMLKVTKMLRPYGDGVEAKTQFIRCASCKTRKGATFKINWE
jgi:DNA-directed RNA polymerase subunit M/transcription elongation factor TFIIS